MNAKDLAYTDWQHIVDSIEEGYTSGQIQFIRNSKEVSLWWSLTNKGIIVTFG